MAAIRIFSSRLEAGPRRVYRGVLIYFLVAAAALMWPIYPLFGAARPLVLGLPLSLFFVAAVLLVSFGVMLALFRWEDRNGLLEEAD